MEDKAKQSEKWGMDISLDTLLKFNSDALVRFPSSHHFETYEGIVIYVRYPNGKGEYSIQLGVDETGIQYEGDYGATKELPKISIELALKLLITWKELIETRSTMERLLREADTEDYTIKFKVF